MKTSVQKIIIKKVADHDLVDELVQIHMQSFKGFFLTSLGTGFLKKMYLGFIDEPHSDVYIAKKKDDIVGFLAYSYDLSGLYRYLLCKNLLAFGWYAFCAFLRKPSIMFKLFRAFLKPSESCRDEKYVELSSIAVLPTVQNCGVGHLLLETLKSEIDFEQYEYLKLETDAENNIEANCFYVKNHFLLFNTYQTAEGRKMNEYRYTTANDT